MASGFFSTSHKTSKVAKYTTSSTERTITGLFQMVVYTFQFLETSKVSMLIPSSMASL